MVLLRLRWWRLPQREIFMAQNKIKWVKGQDLGIGGPTEVVILRSTSGVPPFGNQADHQIAFLVQHRRALLRPPAVR